MKINYSCGNELRSELLEGLTINVPIDLPIDDYIDLIREVQPQINDLVQEEIAGTCRIGSEQAITKIKKRVMEINRQIERRHVPLVTPRSAPLESHKRQPVDVREHPLRCGPWPRREPDRLLGHTCWRLRRSKSCPVGKKISDTLQLPRK